MSEKARIVFNIKEQKAKDVLASIQAVKPVISLIREWGKIEKEYKNLVEQNQKLSEEISSVKHTINLTINGSDLERQLTLILENKSSEYTESIKEEKKLKSICEDFIKEINLYEEYARSFKYVDKTVVEALLELNTFEDKEEFLSMMFLFLVANVSRFTLEPLNRFIGKEGYYTNALLGSNGWNNMLEYLKLNKL